MQKTSIPFSQTNYFSNLIVDYFSGASSLKKYYKYPPTLSSFQQIIEERKKNPVNRKVLVEELQKQYATIFSDGNSSHEAVKKNIKLLESENTFTVTTGHQLNIFTGPLYFIYKILSAINLAGKLNREFPSSQFIPVYWMASEDHDYNEIKNIFVYGKEVAWTTKQTGAVGRFSTEGFDDVIKKLEDILDKNQNAIEVLDLARKAYLKNTTLANATRAFVHSLFSKFGLVIVDSDSRELKMKMIPQLEKEIKEQASFSKVRETSFEMQLEYGLQVQPREINLFYLHNNLRERIIFENNTFKIGNTTKVFTRDEILGEIKNYPERISPNVITRPLYQETILPNLAYIGGPAEVHYWLQLKSTFEEFAVFFPAVLLRNCVMLFNEDVIKKLAKLNLKNTDLFLYTDELIKKYMRSVSFSEISFERAVNIAEKMFEEISVKVSIVDVTLKQTVEAEKTKFFNSLSTIESKVVKAQKAKEEQNLKLITKLRDKYFPNGSIQEREENVLQYLVQYGLTFIDELKDSLEPVAKDFLILEI